MSTLRVSTIQDTAGSNSSTPAAIANGIAKAWVNFNGEDTVAIRAQYNVSSITDNGVGDYTVNFTTALADGNYSYVGTSGPHPSLNRLGSVTSYPFDAGVITRTTTSVRIGVASGGGGNPTQGSTMFDSAYISLAVFR